jgi:hypothetical protein
MCSMLKSPNAPSKRHLLYVERTMDLMIVIYFRLFLELDLVFQSYQRWMVT